jgi:transposase
MKADVVVKAHESLFPRLARKNSNSALGRKDIYSESSRPIFWSVKVSFKNRHEQQKTEGSLQPKTRGKPQYSYLTNAEQEVRVLVAEYPDATLLELCELLANQTGNWVSRTAMCRPKQKLGLTRKKKAGTVAKPPQKESKN